MIVVCQITLSVNIREDFFSDLHCSDVDSGVREFLEAFGVSLPVALKHRRDVSDARHLHTNCFTLTGGCYDTFDAQHDEEAEYFAPDLTAAECPPAYRSSLKSDVTK